MIVVETILREIFTQLPAYKDSNLKEYPIKYEWGDQEDLVLFLKQIQGNKYPLVWLVEGDQEVSRYGHSAERRLRLILAKNSENQTARNPTVWQSEFENCLNPLLENVLTALEASGVTTITDSYRLKRVANYVDNNKTEATDFWNAIILDIDIRFNEKANGEPLCIKQNIKFKNK